MNKNSRARRRNALKNFHSHARMGSTDFDIPVMKPGGYTLMKTQVHIGFVDPPPETRRKQVAAPPREAPGKAAELDNLVADADKLLGKPKFEAPPREPRVSRPARPQKPLGRMTDSHV